MDKVTKGAMKLITVFEVACFAFLIIVVFSQVILRFFFRMTFAWIDELSRYMFVWMMFLGISIGIRSRKHIGIEFFYSLLPGAGKKTMDVITTVATIIFFAVIAWFGFDFSARSIELVSPVLGLRLGLVYAAVPVSSLFNIYFCIMRFFEKPGPERSKEGEA